MAEPTVTTTKSKQAKTRRISLADVPWWVVIVVLVGIYVAYAMLSSEEYIEAFRFILPGVKITLQVTFFAYALALVIGLIAGLMRVSKNPVLYAISTLYVTRRPCGEY